MVLLFSSCTKEEVFTDVETVVVELSAEEFLADYVNQDILFQYSYSNVATGEASGWLIDKKGEVRIYDLGTGNTPATLSDKGVCSSSDLLGLLAETTSNGQAIEAEELVERFKQIRAASHGELTANQQESEKLGTETFYAIIHDNNGEAYSNVGCGDGCVDDSSYTMTTHPYARIILKQSGTDNRINESSQAIELTSWLENIHTDVWN